MRRPHPVRVPFPRRPGQHRLVEGNVEGSAHSLQHRAGSREQIPRVDHRWDAAGSFDLGLEDGDVIQSFNGIKLDSTAAGAKVLNQFVEADEFALELSDGTVRTVSADELSDLLGEGE